VTSSRSASGLSTARLVVIVWLAVSATLLFAGPAELSTDDAMRLVQVRDWLAGQAWFDLTQHRLDPPAGIVMHWSRLIDAPLAALIRVGELLWAPPLAERIAVTIWPLGLLLLFLIGAASLAFQLGGDRGAQLAVVFAALSASVLWHFRPGAIDHHGAQIVLLMVSVALIIRRPVRPIDAGFAGGLCAVSLAIGLEMAPAIAVLAACVALRWIALGPPVARATTSFATAFAITVALLFVAAVPPARYWAAACDALSIDHVGAALIGGLGLGLVSMLSPATLPRRLAGGIAIAAALAMIVVVRSPACLMDPLRVDPRVVALWLSHVEESRSLASLLRDLPHEVIPLFGLPLFGMMLTGLCAVRSSEHVSSDHWSSDSWRWITCAAVLAMLTGYAMYQVRSVAGANALAAALVPAALVRLWPAGQPRALGLRPAAVILVLVFNPVALILAGQAAHASADILLAPGRAELVSQGPGTCRRARDYAVLDTLPRGRVLAFIDAGPMILVQTPHAVLAAPYHRNNSGNLAMLEIMLGSPEDAVARLAARQIDYVAFCPGAAERYIYASAAPNSLAASLAAGRPPVGLAPLDRGESEVRVYTVRP
jgi:hypothetical protein